MPDPVTQFMAYLAAKQTALTPPAMQRAVQSATPEPPDTSPGVFPTFWNEETLADTVIGKSFGAGPSDVLRWTVEMHLLFMPMNTKYSVRERRPWVSVVTQAFNGDGTLGGTCTESHLGTVNFKPVTLDGVPYVAATFPLTVQVSA